MEKIQTLIIFVSIFVFSNGTERMLPRGISLAQRLLYDSFQDFTCLDGTLRLPFGFVNDDYCDCQDGSDEPGTSACPNGRFHCDNVGFVPLDLPASRVNDGVCDCCDASDEYLSDNCTNICQMLGAEAKKAAEKEAEIASQGNELRLQMIAAGKDIRQQKQDRLAALESDKLESTRLKEEASYLKQIAESAEFSAMEVYRVRKQEQKAAEEKREKEILEQEAKEIFNQLDDNHDNVLQKEELIFREVFDQNKDGLVSEEEFKVFFNSNNDVSWDSFLDAWPKIKSFFLAEKEQNDTIDEKEQGGGSVTIDYKGQATETPKYYDEDKDILNREPDVDDEQNIDHRDEEEAYTVSHQEVEEAEVDKQEEVEEEKQEELEETKPEDHYDENTLKLIDEANKARSRFESAERSLQDVERELTRLKDSLEKDYGTEDEFIPLDGQCFTYSDREYTYKLCPFDQVVQMGKSGGSETRLGVWTGWIEDSQHKIMLYDKGQTCWNGPQRSTKVTLLCGLETAVIGASEPNKCEYELTFQTPAACKMPTVSSHQGDTHDEF